MHSIISAIIFSSVAAYPQVGSSGVVTDALTPPFELRAGVSFDGKENCDGIILNGKQLNIPCFCPPPRELFLKKLQENVDAGSVLGRVKVTFPTGNSLQDQLARIDAATATLQSFNGTFGIGCPAASTTFVKQRQALQPIAPVPVIEVPIQVRVDGADPINQVPAAKSNASSVVIQTGGSIDASLVPEFGLSRGLNPTGTGDCDGITVNGAVKKIPCFCPPDRASFIQKLDEFVRQGNVFGSPISFPTGSSNADKLARLDSSVIALQSFNGTRGVGCPVVSTTFGAQKDALRAT